MATGQPDGDNSIDTPSQVTIEYVKLVTTNLQNPLLLSG